MSTDQVSPDPDLPPLEREPPDLYESPSPADPSSEDPITRSVKSGQLSQSKDDSALDGKAESDKPTSPTHSRSGSTIRGGSGSALSVLNLLRGRGQVVGEPSADDDDGEEEDMHGMGMPLSMLRAPGGATGADMKKELKDLHPYAQILGPMDIGSCVELERSVFPPDQSASREKINYRLNTCGELSLGIFSSAEPGSPVLESPTAAAAHTVESRGTERKGVLLAGIMATKTQNHVVLDTDMILPVHAHESSGKTEPKAAEQTSAGSPEYASQKRGHDEAGRTIAMHSLAVVPQYQSLGLGKMLLKAYVQRVMEADVADRIAILTYQRLIPFYAKMGFENRGKSGVQYGGGGWVNMVLEFEGLRKNKDEDD